MVYRYLYRSLQNFQTTAVFHTELPPSMQSKHKVTKTVQKQHERILHAAHSHTKHHNKSPGMPRCTRRKKCVQHILTCSTPPLSLRLTTCGRSLSQHSNRTHRSVKHDHLQQQDTPFSQARPPPATGHTVQSSTTTSSNRTHSSVKHDHLQQQDTPFSQA